MSATVDENEGMHYRDDDREGFELRIIRGNDGDFHLSIWPHAEDMELEEATAEGAQLYRNSIRIRSAWVGGGSHEQLYRVLHELWMLEGPGKQ